MKPRLPSAPHRGSPNSRAGPAASWLEHTQHRSSTCSVSTKGPNPKENVNSPDGVKGGHQGKSTGVADPPAEAPWGPTGVPSHPPRPTPQKYLLLCAARPHVSPAAEWLRWLWEPWMALPHAHNLDLEQSPWKVWHRSPHAPLPAPRSSRASCFTMCWGSPPHSLWAHHAETFHSPLHGPVPLRSQVKLWDSSHAPRAHRGSSTSPQPCHIGRCRCQGPGGLTTNTEL